MFEYIVILFSFSVALTEKTCGIMIINKICSLINQQTSRIQECAKRPFRIITTNIVIILSQNKFYIYNPKYVI